jgi:preprotein translocase subunit SecE
MAAEAVEPGRWQSLMAFLRDSYHEVRFKTTWPDYKQVQSASIAIIVFVLIIGLVITVLDAALRGLLVQLVPSLFR